MGTAKTRTLLPLDRFFQIISYSPILANQVTIPILQPATSCSDPILQYTWQPLAGGKPGREEIAQAIQQAEATLEEHLHFPVMPTWVVDDRITPVRHVGRGMGGTGFWGCGWWYPRTPYKLDLIASRGYVIEGGQEAWSLIDDAVPVVYTDDDGDGYDETATAVVTTTVTDPDQISIFYPGESGNTDWEIRPIKVVISGGSATITFRREQAVKPELLESLNASAVDGLTDSNFLTTVDVYRHYNDPSQMAVVEWEGGICDDTLCTINAQTACIYPLKPRQGVVNVHAGEYDADDDEWEHVCPTWWQQPTSVRLWYRAGYKNEKLPRPYQQMDPQLERAVTYLALTYLDRPWADCEQFNALMTRWRQDVAISESSQSGSIRYNVPRGLLENPLGTTRAAIFAWRVVQQMSVGQAVTAN